MKNKQFSKYLCFPIIAFSFLNISCSTLINTNEKDLYGEFLNLHHPAFIKNGNSPFNELAEKAFSNPSDNKHFVHILDIGDEALLARVHLIRNAQKSIYIQTFIWRFDESGRFIIDELIKAANRGVKVYVIADKLGIDDDPHMLAYFLDANPNIHMKLYNPSAESVTPSALHVAGQIAFKFKKFNQRMHNKIMVFDDQIAITGGRNFENDYFDRGEKRNFKDRDILVIGSIVRDMTDSFNKYWAFKWSVDAEEFIDVIKSKNNKEYEKFITDEMFNFGVLFDRIDKQSRDYGYIEQRFVDNSYPTTQIEFIYDLPGKNKYKSLKGGGLVAEHVSDLLKNAEKQIIMQTPYLVLDKGTFKAAKKIRRKNKDLDIRISTNSMASTDKLFAYAYSFKQRKRMVKNLKFRIFEFKPHPEDKGVMMPLVQNDYLGDVLEKGKQLFEPERLKEKQDDFVCVHAKSYVIDDKIAWIGSFNLDPRSIHLNTEVGVTIHDKQIAHRLKENILRDMAPQNSWTVGKVKGVPIVSNVTDIVGSVAENVPLVDVWPFEYSSLYELKEDSSEVPFFDKDFYKRYTSVGSFPEVGMSLKQIQLKLIESLGGFAEPLI